MIDITVAVTVVQSTRARAGADERVLKYLPGEILSCAVNCIMNYLGLC